MTESNQVVLIGLDGADPARVDSWIDDGYLPNIEAVETAGTSGHLESTVPPWTPVAWPSLCTGVNPGKHGVFDFFHTDGYERNLIDRTEVDGTYLWEAVDAAGKTPLVVNFPVTHPTPSLDNGALVPGYLAPEDATFEPADIRQSFEESYEPYKLYPTKKEGTVERYLEVAQCRRDMAEFLAGQYDWDLLAVEFQVTDTVFHETTDTDVHREVYEGVDELVGEIVDLADDPSVYIVSDHGMGEYTGVFYPNTWLRERGDCRTTAGDVTYFDQEKSTLTGKEDDKNGAGALIVGAANKLSKVGLTPHRAERFLSTVGLSSLVQEFLGDSALDFAESQTVDWESSTAYQIYFNSWGININENDPDGVLASKGYEEYRAAIISDLEGVSDEDGRPVFEQVERREDVYEGENLENAPDLIVFPRDCTYDIRGSILGPYRSETHYNHKRDGVVLFDRGDAGSPRPGPYSIYDVAPSIAAELGIPLNTSFDGELLWKTSEEFETTPWSTLVDPETRGETSRGDDQEMRERLQDLGYME